MYYKTLSFIGIWAYLFLISISYGHAASVRQVTIDKMLQQCQFVFEGTVLTLEAEENSQKRIHTYVTFEIQDIIKGEYSSSTITLSFLGGTVGDVTMGVSDMKVPQVGEHGIYFVESLDRSQVHPLYGWSQGHFIVETNDTGANRIMTSRKKPVIRLEFAIPIKQETSEKSVSQTLSNGVAYGITIGQEKKDTRGLTLVEFKKALHERLDETNE
jgi:hypothetical protein